MSTMRETPDGLPEAYLKAGEVMLKRLMATLSKPLPQIPGIYKIQVGGWTIECHGHPNQVIDGLGPFQFRLHWNGWPAGFITPVGGLIAAGALANEDTFIEAMNHELEETP